MTPEYAQSHTRYAYCNGCEAGSYAVRRHSMNASRIAVLPLLTTAVGCAASRPSLATPSLAQANEESARHFQTNVLDQARANEAYRRVLFSGARSQLVLMTIRPGEDIGLESHAHVEQLIFIASGHGKAIVNGAETPAVAGDVIIATPNARHNIVNTGTEPLRIYTIYAPPNHLDGRLHAAKVDAETDKADALFGAAVR
jgi:mannose-6-phosphate isomerase-like protein (cupin superfamily)